ncbi:MarR family winged helix-turn-helix transcriptional regulator [Kribbella sp. NBC_01505]|uniref:MarR family winged helix-turn-helix transcriptional regulator n=1 Tax=Kribbella sp. NBC_01505 TaxID=2903580 RepID=UPI0038634D11
MTPREPSITTASRSLVPAELQDRTDYLLCKVSETLKRLADDTFAAHGLRGSHHAVLRVLAACGPVTQQDVAGRLYVDPSTIVDLIDHLEEQGLIVRERNPRDRRAYLVQVTDEGRTRLSVADATAASLQESLFVGLDPHDRDQLHELLGKLAALPESPDRRIPLTGEASRARRSARRRRSA